MNLTRFRFIWTGFQGAPGYSNFYVSGAEDPTVAGNTAAAIRTMLGAFTAYLPDDVQIKLDQPCAVIDDATGQQVGAVTVTQPAVINGGSSAIYSAASGFVVDWLTGAFENGRQVRGRTFLVPAASTAYTADGQVATGVITAGAAAVTTYLAAVDGAARILQRPTASRPVGSSKAITAGAISPKVAVLRSRRD